MEKERLNMSRLQEIMQLEGFKSLTPIQEAVIHRKNPDRDLIGISSTGSGKSHAFFIPILEKINPNEDKVQAVISVPTRELAYQLYERMRKLCDHFGIRVRLVTGGMEKKTGGLTPQIVIGTPGRMKDEFLEDNTLRLDTAKIVVIDEADMTMEFGFLEDVDMILSKMDENVQLMVFSATIPENLQPFLKKYLHNPEMVSIKADEKFQADVTKYLIPARHKTYQEKLLEVLPAIQPYVCLIFANTTQDAAKTADMMRAAGYDLVELHSGMESRARNQAIRQIQSQKKSYIVASDIASRGIDLEGITHVISLGFPKDLKFFTHRIGRTGRAGRDGLAIAIYRPEDEKTVDILTGKGMEFIHMDVKGSSFKELKPRVRKVHHKDPLEKEIAKVVNKKKKKVKPNYKKRQSEEIERLRRKRKREIIKKDIARQKKERAKQKQREKREGKQ
jgi:ATP-dependent RNA helicase CshB